MQIPGGVNRGRQVSLAAVKGLLERTQARGAPFIKVGRVIPSSPGTVKMN